MANSFVVKGGHPLRGKYRIHGAKNAILPILAACILCTERIVLHDCPRLADVQNMIKILEHIGCKVTWEGESIIVDPSNLSTYSIPDSLGRELRSSIFLIGSILARFSIANASYPGGCDIGLRPIDLHLKGLKAIGAIVVEEHGQITVSATQLTGGEVYLDYPSVGATENIMMAATAAKGITVIRNAAKEPEIVELQNFLNSLGAHVRGAGTGTITVMPAKLHGIEYKVLPDRIVAGTMMVAAAITNGEITLENTRPEHIAIVIAKLRETGCLIDTEDDIIHIKAIDRPRAVKSIETLPYPGFPTDMQPQMLALQTVSQGTSVVIENVFENRFRHVAELRKLGADITIKDRTAIITGVKELLGAEVSAFDLRGGASLVLAALRAKGKTRIKDVSHIDRGYFQIEKALSELGADIVRV